MRYNWPISAHASQAFSIAHCTDSEDLPTIPKVRYSEDLLLGLGVRVRIAYVRHSGPSEKWTFGIVDWNPKCFYTRKGELQEISRQGNHSGPRGSAKICMDRKGQRELQETARYLESLAVLCGPGFLAVLHSYLQPLAGTLQLLCGLSTFPVQ